MRQTFRLFYFIVFFVFILVGIAYAQTLESRPTTAAIRPGASVSGLTLSLPSEEIAKTAAPIPRTAGFLKYSFVLSNVTDKNISVSTPFGTFTLGPRDKTTVLVSARPEEVTLGFKIITSVDGSKPKEVFIKPKIAGKDFTLDATILLSSLARSGFISHELSFEYWAKFAPAYELNGSLRARTIFGVFRELARDARVSVLARNYISSLVDRLENYNFSRAIPTSIWTQGASIPDPYDTLGGLTSVLVPKIFYQASKILAEQRHGSPTDKMLSAAKLNDLIENTISISANDKKLLSGSYEMALAIIQGDRQVVNCSDDKDVVHEATVNECNRNGWKIKSDCRAKTVATPTTSFSIIAKAFAQETTVSAVPGIAVKLEPALFDSNNFKRPDERAVDETYLNILWRDWLETLPGRKLPPWTPFVYDCDDFAWNFIQFLISKGKKDWSYTVSGGSWNHAYIDWKSPDGKTTYYFDPMFGKAYKEIPKDTKSYVGDEAYKAWQEEQAKEDFNLKKLEGWLEDPVTAGAIERGDLVIVYVKSDNYLKLVTRDEYLNSTGFTPLEKYVYGKDFRKYKR